MVIAWSADGAVLVVGEPHRVRAWSWPHGRLMREVGVPCDVVAASGATLAVGAPEGLSLHYVRADRPAPAVALAVPVTALSASWDGASVVAAAGGDLWEVRVATGRARVVAGPGGPVSAVAHLPGAGGLVVATAEGLAWGAAWSRQAASGVRRLRTSPAGPRRAGVAVACGEGGSWRWLDGAWVPVAGPAADVAIVDEQRLWWVGFDRTMPALGLEDVADVAVMGTWVAVVHRGGIEVVDTATGVRRSVG